jgi:hypothetical protein
VQLPSTHPIAIVVLYVLERLVWHTQPWGSSCPKASETRDIDGAIGFSHPVVGHTIDTESCIRAALIRKEGEARAGLD